MTFRLSQVGPYRSFLTAGTGSGTLRIGQRGYTMRSMTRDVLAFVLVFVAALATTAPGNTAEIVQWRPSESFPGGTQYDARLDTTVTFWRAGVTLGEVFEGIRQQTGVTLTFYPKDDENRRVRVNLFLNQSEPPTLRALMAQLTWVVDCPFFISDVDGQILYSLASTSIGAGAEHAILARREAHLQAREQLWTSMDEKLDECRQALSLSREELIRRYRGKDDFLLLNLLDPARRAATQFLCRHLTQTRPPGWGATLDVDELSWGRGLMAREFTSEDLVDLQAVHGALPAWVQMQVAISSPSGEASVMMRLPKPVTTGPDGKPTRGPDSLRHLLSFPPPLVLVSLPSPALLSGEEEAQLRRSLGERITPEQEEEFVSQRDAELQAAARQRKQAEQETRRALSPEAKERLDWLALPSTTSGYYRRWQLFEALASASGYHVVSDAFQNDGVAVSLANGGKKNEWPRPVMPYLDALTVTRRDRTFRSPMWEWGDAGTFLRFRSTNRDIHRAALLPEDFLRWVDGLVYPYLPKERETRSVVFALSIDLPEWTRQLGRLTSMQLRFGASVSQAAPDDFAGSVRNKVLDSVLRAQDPDLVHFLRTLSDAQWQRLRAEGLSGPADLSRGQMRLLAAWVSASPGPPVPSDYSRISISIADTGDGSAANDQPEADRSDRFCKFEATVWKLEKIRHGDEESEQETSGAHRGGDLPKQVTVHVELPVLAGRL
jgi:hypothetical protein